MEEILNLDLNAPIFSFLLRVLIALLIIVIGKRLAKWGRNSVERALKHAQVTESLIRLGMVTTYYGILMVVVVVALAVLGFPITVVLGVTGVVLIILGIALQESLASFAATVQFWLFQPFRIGDLIETTGVMGIVKEIQFFNTVIVTIENKTVTIANNQVRDSNIVNYSDTGILRADVFVNVSYKDDLRQVKQLLEQIVAEDARVLPDPVATVVVLDFEDIGIKMGIRPFVKTADYWQIQFDFRERIKQKFDENGITIPYLQRDIQMVQGNS